MDAGLAGESARIKTLVLPTLVIWGGKDRLIPLRFGQQFAHDIVGSRLVVFDDLGHLPQQEAPLLTVLALQKFLDTKPPN